MADSTPLMKLSPTFAAAAVLLLVGCDVDHDHSALEDAGVEFDDGALDTPEDMAELVAPTDPAGAAADCCAPDWAPGCTDLAVQACVCAADSYCCTTAWDGLCVNEVTSLGCGTCAVPCCQTQASPGCTASAVESCVCAADAYCCTTAWDAICVNEVESLGCGVCSGPDVVITEMEVPSVACRGENIGPPSSVELSNAGSVSIASRFTMAWYLSSDADLGGGDSLLIGGRDNLSSLGAGGSQPLWLGSNTIPADADLGPQYLILSADDNRSIAEVDEDNNVLAVPITIVATCAG